MGLLQSIFGKKPAQSVKPVVLLILDGWGLAPDSPGNAITQAKTPTMDRLNSLYPHGVLLASGESVGLPANEVGNTEVGHINLGAGRIILQDFKRISKTITDGTFFDNRAIRLAIDHAKKNSSKLHIAGMVGSGHVHSSIDHFWALLEYCRKQNFSQVYVHLFTDGRDTPPQEAKIVIKEVQDRLASLRFGHIATISGRYYAMDRDRRWDRTEVTYKAMVEGDGVREPDALKAISNAYAKGETDEFIKPVVITQDGQKPLATVDDNDAFILFNFRVDRPRQLTMAFVLNDFENSSFSTLAPAGSSEKDISDLKAKIGPTFQRKKVPKNLFFVTMTEYQKGLPVSAVAFPPEPIASPLGDIIAGSGLKQLHIAESEKRRFITYYFNGLKEEPFKGEDVVIVSSPHIATYDLKPEMSIHELVGQFKNQIARKEHRFIIMNFANPDMVAHTGNLKATISAVETVDQELGNVVNAVLALDGTIIVTADHGNAEELFSYPASSYFFTSSVGTVNTDHSGNPVPVIIINKAYEGKAVLLSHGILADVAPTILAILGLPKPSIMTGRNLLQTQSRDAPAK